MTTDGPQLRFAVPFAKVDAESRTVSGFATLDNVDQHGDIVTAEASNSAFSRFRGNLREMHAPIAVGKVLSFDETEFFDEKSGQMYRGIFVSSYVSKGAEDTWQKVLDGTLTGFSIGGKVLADEEKFMKDADGNGRQVRVINDYELIELSLVDSPANQLANVLSIVKSADGSQSVSGIAVDVRLENILYCAEDKFAITTTKDIADCASCGTKMTNIGWVESNASDKVEKIRDAVAKATLPVSSTFSKNFYNPTTTTSAAGGYTFNITVPSVTEMVAKQVSENNKDTNTLEGGVDVPEEKTETVVEETAKVTETTETAPNEEVAPTEEAPAADDKVEKAANVEEVENEEIDLVKMFSDFATEIKDVLTSSKEATEEIVKSVKADLETTVAALDAKVSDLSEKFGSLEATSVEVTKRVDAVESDTAIKKSSDLGRSEDKIEKNNKSVWSGAFLSTAEIVN